MRKQLIHAKDWKKPEEKIVMSQTDALRILKEASPHVHGTTVGSHPYIEKLASVVGVDLKQVN